MNFGELEARVIHALSRYDQPVAVGPIHKQLGPSRRAYTTIKTILDRLTDKGVATRQLQGKKFLYTLQQDYELLIKNHLQDFVNTWLLGDWDKLRALAKEQANTEVPLEITEPAAGYHRHQAAPLPQPRPQVTREPIFKPEPRPREVHVLIG